MSEPSASQPRKSVLEPRGEFDPHTWEQQPYEYQRDPRTGEITGAEKEHRLGPLKWYSKTEVNPATGRLETTHGWRWRWK